MKIHFGKHKGKDLDEIPSDYLEWILRNLDVHFYFWEAVDNELKRRDLSYVTPEDMKPLHPKSVPAKAPGTSKKARKHKRQGNALPNSSNVVAIEQRQQKTMPSTPVDDEVWFEAIIDQWHHEMANHFGADKRQLEAIDTGKSRLLEMARASTPW